MTALTSWVATGRPDDPGAWLYRVAHNNLIGVLRKDTGRLRIVERTSRGSTFISSPPLPARFDQEVHDDLLRMLFVCCDETIPRDSRLVLALKTLCGFSTTEIARRLFLRQASVLKRLGRARERLRETPPEFDVLPLDALRPRLNGVHTVLYLLFNEGYLAAQPDRMIRREMCDEAVRLATLLARHPVGAVPETFALLALMHFHRARLEARVDGAGGLVLLEEQDRSLWDEGEIRQGAEWLQKSAEGQTFSRFHAEAAIAAEHALAPSFAQTRWKEIVDLYSLLDALAPSPLNALNRAVAMAEWQGPEAGLALLRGIDPPTWLLGFHLWDAVHGELERRAGREDRARPYLDRALASAPTEAEKRLLRRRLASLR